MFLQVMQRNSLRLESKLETEISISMRLKTDIIDSDTKLTEKDLTISHLKNESFNSKKESLNIQAKLGKNFFSFFFFLFFSFFFSYFSKLFFILPFFLFEFFF